MDHWYFILLIQVNVGIPLVKFLLLLFYLLSYRIPKQIKFCWYCLFANISPSYLTLLGIIFFENIWSTYLKDFL